ncbi:M20 family metallopeptidase [Clostridioides difficile]|uniref:M20 family metallopeptidase n=1 Tax=Clostridioides difficile TaxID=1496 RepID=UPI0003180DA5|nr:M20 family metallopeptidase [Clostridioides difficile]ALP02273.1 Putative dipeptidase [Clostridioides difficile]EGT3745576.1 M20 family peptidase [Clostridioides difficile]EGT4070749.1 M20 family peptidase [Clostridioides difficile]EGT4106955.1 M20 family peptidase [Clostridioides difficile]EGT4134379.1 M20 family peptidase [Clostridioides difficile]
MDISRSVDNSLNRTIEFLKELIKIDSQQGEPISQCPFGIGPKKSLDKTLDYCASLGFSVKNIDNYIGYAEIGEGEELIGIPMHLDIVPPGEGWSVDPFSGAVIDNIIYGRGVIDNKGAVSMLIHVLKNIEDMYPTINKRIRLIFGTNEETGMKCIKYYLDKGEEIPSMGFTPDAMYPVVNGEKGRVHIRIEKEIKIDKSKPYILVRGGTKENVVPSHCTAKIINGIISELTTKGVAVHASNPEKGENAISKMVIKIVEDNMDFQHREDIELVSKYLCSDYYGDALGINQYDEVFKNTTLNLGILKVNEEKIVCELDIRYGKNIVLNNIIDRFKKVFCNGWKIEVIAHKDLHYVDESNLVLKKLLEAYEEVTDENGYTIAMGGGTYASWFKDMVAFGPKFLAYKTGGHGVDERVPINHIRKNMEIYTLALIKLLEL